MLVERKTETGDGIDGVGDEQNGTATDSVRGGREEEGRVGLKDNVESDSEIDGLKRGVKVGSEERQQRKVDGRCER